MSPSSGQAWTRRIRTGYYDEIRVSDAERAEVADLLGRHYSDGRLDKQEFDERVARAMVAKTRGDLDGLFDDLPSLDGPAGGPGSGPGGIGGPGGAFGPGGGLTASARGYGISRRRRGHPILGVIVAVLLVSLIWHGLFHIFFVPWFAILVLVAVVVIVNRATHRHHHDHHQRQDQ
jgi:hypothetical protein